MQGQDVAIGASIYMYLLDLELDCHCLLLRHDRGCAMRHIL